MLVFRILVLIVVLSIEGFTCYAQSLNSPIVYQGELAVSDNSSEMPRSGVEISSTRNEVRSVLDGEVITSFIVNGKYSVLIKSNDHVYVYNKLGAVSAKKGDMMKAGDVIGTLLPIAGNKYLLHFEVWKETKLLSYSDTKSFLGFTGPN